MSLIQEDGSGLPNAQTYAVVTDLRAYAALRGVTTLPTADAACEVLLINGMDRLSDESLNFKGCKLTRDQALDWPRYDVWIDEWYVPANEIPRQLIACQCAFAIESMTTDLLPTTDVAQQGAILEETVGPITTTYANTGVVRRVPLVAKAETLLRLLVKRNGLIAIRT